MPPPRRSSAKQFFRILGPGLITGASDDDPSGLATYSQVGAQFGYGLGWTLPVSFPLMAAIQEISARIGRVTGRGIAGNLRDHVPGWLAVILVALLAAANLVNLAADLGAMGAALKLLIGGPALAYVCLFGLVSAGLQIFTRYARYVAILKWLCLSLLAYVACAFVVRVDWLRVARELVMPPVTVSRDYLMGVVAVLGTTISPYLFFWQAEQEVEDGREKPGAKPLRHAPEQADPEFRRIRLDTYIGMAVSNLIAFFIVVTAAATLHAAGKTEIHTSAEAAEALRAIAGPLTFFVFAAGIIGTGLLALPALSGSAAFAIGEMRAWPVGLAKRPHRAKGFYGVIAAATALGAAMNFGSVIDPVRALYWSAVLNGVVAVPVMVVMMLISVRREVMGGFVLPPALQAMGWIATALMTAAVGGMLVSL